MTLEERFDCDMTRTSRTAAAGLEALVDDYIQWFRPERERELSQFRSARTDEDAISDAALARLPDGKKHRHQCRNPPASLKESRRLLLDNLSQVRDTTSFQELIELVDHLIRPLDRMGEMVVYDTALRIGARFGREPEKVYVHRGTRDGIRKLGLDARPTPGRCLAGRSPRTGPGTGRSRENGTSRTSRFGSTMRFRVAARTLMRLVGIEPTTSRSGGARSIP
jgi:hypothetical protein